MRWTQCPGTGEISQTESCHIFRKLCKQKRVPVQFIRMRKENIYERGIQRRPPEPGRSNWSLRAPPFSVWLHIKDREQEGQI